MHFNKEKVHREPQFIYHDKITQFYSELFKRWYTDDRNLKDLIISSILVRDSKVLLIGPPEAGKTTLIRLIAKGLSKKSNNPSNGEEIIYAKVIGAPEKTLQKVLVTTNITKLLREGEEEFIVRPIVKARVKFINEINRFSKAVQDALLSLLEEKEIEYGGIKFTTPSFIAYADMNPYRGEIDRALQTRFMVSAYVPLISLPGSIKVTQQMFQTEKEVRDLVETMPEILSIDELEKIWRDTEKVAIPFTVSLFAHMLLWAFRACKFDKSRIIPGYLRLACAQCEYNNEICSHILIPPGERAIISALLFAKARAWFYKRKRITYDDVIWIMPWVVAHRIELVASIKAEVPNPWEWSKNAVRTLIETKWHSHENGKETFGVWAKGLALASLALGADLDHLLNTVLEMYYPELLRNSDGFKALKELRSLAYGEKDGRGDLVLQELYKLLKEKYTERSRKMLAEIEPKAIAIASKENVELDEILEILEKLNDPLPEDTEKLRDLVLARLEELTIRISLMMPGVVERVREVLQRYGFSTSEITRFLQGQLRVLKNDYIQAKIIGGFLTIRAKNSEIAQEIREYLEG
ncbi:MAG: AAA family ATPase [Candidatus Njordarchaeales archaeon]